MAVWRDWMLWLVAGILLLTTPLEVYVIVRTSRRLPTAVTGSPLQTLEKRLAGGEISAEEFQYERYLLEKGE
jgi:hypothetical protein